MKNISPFQSFLKENALAVLLFALLLAGVFVRPLLPIDETRYMTAAWEMHLNHNWFLPTLNFAPYHHKPPLLFWLINLSWSILGVSRWAAALVPIGSAMMVVFLTGRLAEKIFPEEQDIKKRARLLLLGSFPFVAYASIIMFDMMLTVFVLVALLSLLAYAQDRRPRYIICWALCLGFGVLAKGPVVLVYTLPLALLMPFWFTAAENKKFKSWYAGVLGGVLLSIVPVLIWLVPMLMQVDFDYAYQLLWHQSAGRVTGSFNNAHHHPFYFYLPLLPVLALPWAFLPSFYKGIKNFKTAPGLRFLAAWFFPTFLAFCLISGKQPHYMVPLLPAVLMATAYFLRAAPERILKRVALASFAIFAIGHAYAAQAIFPLYDLRPLAAEVQKYPDENWAFVRKYQGEIGFLARRSKPFTSLEEGEILLWLEKNPQGYAVVRYRRPEEVKGLKELYVQRYRRSQEIGIFVKGDL